MNEKVLVTDDVNPSLLEGLSALGYEVDYHPKMPYPSVCEAIAAYHGVVINSKVKADASFIQSAPLLKFIARLGSGLEIIDLQAAKKAGIKVINSPAGNCDAVAEHALGMLLMLLNHLVSANQDVRIFQWNREGHRGNELRYRKVGIVGFGHTGAAFAHKLSGLVDQIWLYDKYKTIVPTDYLKVCHSLEALISKVDVISFHLPLSDETKHVADQSLFEMLQEGTILINTSRGQVIETNALIAALQVGKVGGACLDVFENEKPATYSNEEQEMYKKLFAYDQVLVSPHVAGWTVESKKKIADIILQKIRQAFHSA